MMTARHRPLGSFRLLVLTGALAAGWTLATVAVAASDKNETALKLVPADASFFTSMTRGREQFDVIAHSQAWAKLQKMPVVQQGLAVLRERWNTPELQNPEVQKVFELLAQMASDEMFVYGDKNCDDFVKLFQEINAAQNYGPLMAMLNGETGPQELQRAKAAAVISSLAENVELIGVPNLVFGFRLRNTDLAKEELIKLETFANILLESNERTKGHFKRTKIDGHDYLVLELDGDMLPWDEAPLENFEAMEAEAGDVQKIVKRIKGSKLVVALGIRENYLLCSIGSSLECLKAFGKGSRLLDRPEFKPLAKHAGERLISVGYMSRSMSQRLGNSKEDIDNLLELVDEWLPQSNLTEQQRGRLRGDAKSLAGDIKKLIPDAGPSLTFALLSGRGIESYRYAWGGQISLDGSKPLGLLRHVGGDPIVAVAVRGKSDIGNYDTIVKWAKVAYGYFREFGLPLMEKKDREKLVKLLDDIVPLLKRADHANREWLIPALADGQTAFVLDRKLASKQLVKDMPAMKKPMPFLEPAMVVGVSDVAMLKKAMSEYRAIINGTIEAVSRLEDVEIPKDFRLPPPQVTKTAAGEIYSFPLPKAWGVDPKVVPNFGVSGKVAVFSASRDHTERLLKETSPTVGGVLADMNRPRAMAAWLNWAALVEAASPWVDFAAERAMAENGLEKDGEKIIVDQVHTALDVLKVMRTITEECYFEDGATVVHTLAELRDVK